MNKKNISLSDLRVTSSSLLSLTVKELFPKAVALGGGATGSGFYSDFIFPFPFDSSLLKQIEEGMFSFIRKKEKVFLREMVPFSAREYFISQGEWAIAEILKQSLLPIVDLMVIAGRMFLVENSQSVDHLGEIGALKLHKGEALEKADVKNGIRIYGTAFFDKNELKQFLKKKEDWVGISHVTLGREKEFFKELEPGKFFWLPKGQKIKLHFMKQIQALMEEEGFFSVSTLPAAERFSMEEFRKRHQKIFESNPRSFEGKWLTECVIVTLPECKVFSLDLFESVVFQANLSHLFCKENLLLEKVISCLHFMTKIFKILDFEFQIAHIASELKKRSSGNSKIFLEALKGLDVEFVEELEERGEPRLEWRMKDRLGRQWPVSCICAPKKVKKDSDAVYCLPVSFFLSFERIIALVIEDRKGEIPF